MTIIKLTCALAHHMRYDYWCYVAANYQDNHAPEITDINAAP